MDAPILLREYEDWQGGLSLEDAQYIASELRGRISITRAPFSNDYLLNPSQYVGVVVLPSTRRLESQPKIPVRNLFYMLAIALDLPSPFREKVTQFERLDEMLEFVADHFAGEVEERVRRGLYRAYLDAEGNLQTIRGRIDFPRDVQENAILRHRTYCRFGDLSWDIPENQILRQVAHLLSGWGFQRRVRLRLAQLDGLFVEVTPTQLSPAILERIHYSRLNDDYRPLHALCRLFLQGASLSEEVGPFDFRTFLLDMNALFEQFVTEVLVSRAPIEVEVQDQHPLYLDWDHKVLMRPDVIVAARRTRDHLAVDCKYKRLESGELRNDDIYQLVSYCLALSARHGVLVYPSHLGQIRQPLRITGSDQSIHSQSLDLRGDLPALKSACDELARSIFQLLHWE